MSLRPLLLTSSAFLAAVHVVGLWMGAAILPWAAVAAFVLLLIHAAYGRNVPLLAALVLLAAHAIVTMPPAMSHSGANTLRLESSLSAGEPPVIGEPAMRELHEVGVALVAVLLLLAASLRAGRPPRRAVLAGGIAAALLIAYAALRVGDVVLRIEEGRWATGRPLALVVAAPVAVGLAATALGVLTAGRSRAATAGAALLVLDAAWRVRDAVTWVLLPWDVSMAVAAGLVRYLPVAWLAGIILVVAGLSDRAAGGRVREG